MTSLRGSSKEAPVLAAEKTKGVQMKPRNVLIMFGSMLLLFVLFIPLLDANRLMEDQTFVFFVGRALPQRLAWICMGTIFLYIFLMFCFFACARDEAKTDTSVYLIFSFVITVLGLSLLMISVPLKRETMSAYQEIFTNCQFGPRTQRLYEYSTVLQGIRATPACSLLRSVTMCDGYQESMPYTGFLSAMESQYKCAGFCYGNSSSAAAAVAVAAEPEVTNTYTTTLPAPATPAFYSVGAMMPPTQTFASAGTNLRNTQAMMMPPVQTQQAFAATNPYQRPSLSRALQELARQKRAHGEVSDAMQQMAQLKMEGRKLDADLKAALLQAPSSRDASSSSKDAAVDALPENLAPQNFAGFSERFGQAPGPAPAVEATITTTTVPNITRATPGKQGSYPPTLFSDNNYQASCDGSAARDLKYQAMHVANIVYCEGVFLLCSVLLGGLLRICGFCIQLPAPRWKKPVLTAAPVLH